MSSHPFITTTVLTQQIGNILTNKINAIYLVGTKGTGGTIAANELKLVPTLVEFDAIVGANSASKPAYRFLRLIDNSVPVYFVNGLSTATTPTLVDHLVAGFLVLAKNIRLAPGIIISPEAATLATGQETVFAAAQNLVSDNLMNWEYYHNLSTAANDKTKALAEAAVLNSPQGHSSCFWGFGKDSDNNNIPLSVVAAARTTFINRNRIGYYSPAAFQDPIPFSSVDEVFLPKWYIGTDEYTELNDKGINTIFLDGDGLSRKVYTLCGARTLSKDTSWRYMNTRYAANDIFARTAEVLKPFLFLPTDVIQGENNVTVAVGAQDNAVNADVILSLKVLLDQIAAEGAFSVAPLQEDGTQPDSYTIIPSRLADGNLAITIELYLVQTRERISRSFVKRG